MCKSHIRTQQVDEISQRNLSLKSQIFSNSYIFLLSLAVITYVSAKTTSENNGIHRSNTRCDV